MYKPILCVCIAGPLFISMLLSGCKSEPKCTIATKGDSPVARACAEGGRKAGEAAMKQMVKTAKANGTNFMCGTCHEEFDDYTLKPTAGADFEKLLAAQKK